MDLLAHHLNEIKIPAQGDKIYKDECMFSFDNPESETGLYVSLTSFLGFGRCHVERYFRKTGHSVFLHIRRERREVQSPTLGDGPEKKITRLAIGVEGGFDPNSQKKLFEFEDIYNLVILPDFATISWPNSDLPDIVRKSVQAILDIDSATKLAELESLSNTWDGETRSVSKFAANLTQLDNGIKIPPSGWKCEKCDKIENLWLNLTDGSILCGRRFYDGTGGNNHAIEHYTITNYPLAVKLGTITKEGKADVFSYAEDDMVEDPLLIKHLAHWGINIANMEKTEKSMIEMELELNQKSNEWMALQESAGQLKPMYGPGYTGMVNLGNSCYLNSIMQMIFNIPDFVKKYVDCASTIFDNANMMNAADDLAVQMAKLGVGLVSGTYSIPPPKGSPPDADSPGISPIMFKTLVGRGHADFSTKKQQDAQEFFLYLLTLLERVNKNDFNPGNCFKFQIEDRVQCAATKKVKYTCRDECVLSLNIPLEAAVNKDEVAAYELRKSELETNGKKIDPNALVRPRIKFFSCLEVFTQTENIDQFYSTALKAKTTARKSTRFASFPDYIVIQLKKFTLREDWVPIKLDVAVEMPDLLDLNSFRGHGQQPGEELLPELVTSVPAPDFDEAVLSQLQEMGFPMEACKRAIFFTRNTGLETASSWIMEHITDADFSDPFIPPGTESSAFVPDPQALPLITSMGFTQEQATKALKATDNNVERAVDWIFSHPDELESTTAPAAPPFKDGNGQYKLVAFVSHMGPSSMVGHYVVHILKDEHWVIFNDNKVALSENPPKELGYLYLYQRL
ncbi:hypothetical protein PPYR_14477 [Photinus pyralis]|uniref:Ubiquitin carboxyl-terminal hydrolase n=1 Tax=Photinus pyralis TaxID=7054 RepID=A0A5N4A5G6_PHOPY|nr:ubiquitin carboxyl-terminal hydrolase 5 [Photinus pyralis]KAB0792518.1 hypothetical protein PPYR_14477 [Photinus pyralis]